MNPTTQISAPAPHLPPASVHRLQRRRASLLLLDLPGCLPGLEGAAVLEGGSQAWVGMLLGTMRDPVAQAHYAIAAPAAGIIEAAAGALGRETWSLPRLSDRDSPQHRCTERALRAVVAVSTGGSWGTGVVISPAGHVMTNAHLLRPGGHANILALNTSASAPGQPVQVQVQVGGAGGAERWVPAEVVHIFRGLDVAVLRLLRPEDSDGGPREWPAVQLSQSPVLEGQPVSLAGFPAFNPTSRLGLGPLVSTGFITKVWRLTPDLQPLCLWTPLHAESGPCHAGGAPAGLRGAWHGDGQRRGAQRGQRRSPARPLRPVGGPCNQQHQAL